MRRGAILVLALLIGIVLLVLGFGLLMTQSRAYDESRMLRDHVQAGLLARAGIDSAMLRLSKDIRFPPRLGGRSTFSYAETLRAPDASIVGSYTVTLDVTRRTAPASADPRAANTYLYPWFTVRLRSIGTVAGDDQQVRATRTVDAELDVSATRRGATPTFDINDDVNRTNTDYFRFLRWEDGGGI